MERFEGRIAVITGGGTGMGRELARQLAAEGCHLAICDLSAEHMAETQALALAGAPNGTRCTTHVTDVSDEDAMHTFAAAVAADHDTTCIHLLFNNAGIGGGGSMITDDRSVWDRVFGVCWGGVYHGTRAFLPLLLAAEEGHLVNTSSVNGLWASLGPRTPHTAYSAAKFAVRGFTEALITDFKVNAPHLQAHVVLPGHIGTSIVANTFLAHGMDPEELTEEQLDAIRSRGFGPLDLTEASDEDIRRALTIQAELFRDLAPTTASEAAAVILAGVRAGQWRILVGSDAARLDELVRADPEDAYTPEFVRRLQDAGAFGGVPGR